MTTATARHTGRRQRHRTPVIALLASSVLFICTVVMALSGLFGPAPWASTASGLGPDASGRASWGNVHGGLMGSRSSGQVWGGGSPGMMAGHLWLPGNGQQVTTIGAARARAAQGAAAKGLHPGEVMQFSDNFYVELKDGSGAAVTEVLVDPASGAVQTEPGPAMMWNTNSRDGMISQAQAREAATAWLSANRRDETVATIDAYPGYYTVDTQLNGKIAGMLSVNGATGTVWYHTWHGSFVGMEDG